MADDNDEHVEINPFESATAAVGSPPQAPCEPAAAPATQNKEYFTPDYEHQENIAEKSSMSNIGPTPESWAVFFQNMMAGLQNSNQIPTSSIVEPRKLKASEIYLPPFDPDDCQFTAAQWIEEIEHHKKNNSWSDYEARNAVFTHLQGRAKKWAARSYPLCRTWEELKERLTRQFATTKRFHDLFRDMVEYRSDQAATYIEYSTNKLALIDRLETGWGESNKIEVVISGIADNQVRSELLKNTPSDFVALDRHLSTYSNIRKRPFDKSRSESEPFHTKKPKPNEKPGDRRCHYCNKVGHLKRHCLLLRNNSKSSGNNVRPQESVDKTANKPSQCSYCHKSGHSESTCFTKQRDEKSKDFKDPKSQTKLVNVCSPSNDSLIELRVGGYNLQALIDSGSECSLIKQEIADSLPDKKEFSFTRLTGIGSVPCYSFCKMTSFVEFEGLHTEVTFVITKSDLLPYDVILGRDVFKTPGLVFTLNSKGAKITRDASVNICETQKEFTEFENINTDLVDQCDIDRLKSILEKHKNNFANGNSTSTVNTGTMQIKLKNPDKTVQRSPYRLAPSERTVMREIIGDLEKKGIIRESSSPFSSPALLVKKKDGSDRLCVDYRELNSNTVRDSYPLPLISEQIDTLGQACYFSSLDMASGFHQILMASQSDIEKTAFITPDGVWEYLKMPFGLCNAPSVYQRAINKALKGLKDKIALVYMDDVLVFAKTKEEAFQSLEQVLSALSEAGFTLNWKKCTFLKSSVEYLGYVVGGNSVKPNPEKIKALSNAPLPTCVKELRQFNGLAGYFRKFVPNFSSVMAPLYALTKKDTKWHWTDEHTKAHATVIKHLTSAPVLTIFDPSKPIELHTDASSIGYGAILFQKDDNQLKVVGYFSQRTTDAESRYHSYELETLAVFKALKHFRHYLLGREFKVVTDCNALKASRHKRELLPRVHRWWAYMQTFDFEIEYRKGERIPHVDYLSRNPVSNKQVNVSRVNDEWLQAEQKLDPDIKRIIDSIENDTIDANVRSSYTYKDNLLYRNFQVDGKTLSRVIVPKNFRWQIIQRFHDELKHLGWDKTLTKIRENFWFPNMTSSVRAYVDHCLPCKINKNPSGKKQSILHPIDKIAEPFHTIHIDTSGKLTGGRMSKEYVIVIIDAFTKFCYLFPVKDLTSRSACEALRNFVHIFGTPKRIISDQGTSFTGQEFQNLCRDWAIEFHEIASGVSRANGQVERIMSVLTNCLTIAENHENKSWKSVIGEVQLALNCTVSKSTGKSPFQLLIGLNKSPPRLNFLTVDPDNQDNSSLSDVRQDAKVRMDEIALKDKTRYDSNKAIIRPFVTGDLVLVQKNPRIINKLSEKFSGPCKITKVCKNERYIVEPVSGGRSQYVCHERLRRYPASLPELSECLDSVESPEN